MESKGPFGPASLEQERTGTDVYVKPKKQAKCILAAASEGAMVESAWPESASARSCGGCRPELEAVPVAAATLQAAARRRQARSEHGAAVAAASGCRHETAARSGGLLLKGLSDSSEPRRERSRCSSARR